MNLTPDPQFIRRLKDVDEKLDVGWNELKHRWQVVRENRRVKFMGLMDGKPLMVSYNRPHFVFTVEGEDKSYQPLDERVIDHLREIDIYRYPRIKDFVRELENNEDKIKERNDRRFDEEIHARTKYHLRQLQDGVEELRSGRD